MAQVHRQVVALSPCLNKYLIFNPLLRYLQVHYAIHRPEPHILLYRRPKGYGQNPAVLPAVPNAAPVPMVQ